MNMIVGLYLLCLTLVLAKENFRATGLNGVTDLQALEACFTATLCTLDTGCCNGHGVCTKNGTAAPICVCGSPQKCRRGLSVGSYPVYSGATCNTAPIVQDGAINGCCQSGSDDLIFEEQTGSCYKRDVSDPEAGSKGRLLRRTGAALYGGTDQVADCVNGTTTWNKTLGQMVDVLTGNTRPSPVLTDFNMMSLGFLELAQKDVADFTYHTSTKNPARCYGGTCVTYPSIVAQQNTGIKAGAKAIPKQFENSASGAIDCGFLYDFAVKQGASGHGPHLNRSAAVTYWKDFHHSSNEFIVGLKYIHAYHTYVVRNLEEYICGQNSLAGDFTMSNCSLRVTYPATFASDNDLRDWFYQQGRRSTIRFFENLLETSVLQLTMEYGGNDGRWDPIYEQWFRRDAYPSHGFGFEWEAYTSIRGHQEFDSTLVGSTRTDLSHKLLSAFDPWLSMRNPDTNTTAYNLVSGSSCSIVPSDIASEVINLLHTKTQRYGSQIAAVYKNELANIIHNSLVVGLASYKVTVPFLTGSPSVSDITQDMNAYYGMQVEANSARQYKGVVASLALASSGAAINDAIMASLTSYWHSDQDGMFTAQNYHPDPAVFTFPPDGFGNCYRVPSNGDCTATAKNAAAIILGRHPDMDESPLADEMSYVYRTKGALFPSPGLDGIPTNIAQTDAFDPDVYKRENPQSQTLPQFANPLFYQYDGLQTVAQRDHLSETQLLPNQYLDIIPFNIGWRSKIFDGWCMVADYFSSGCDRVATKQSCGWWLDPYV